MKKYKLFLFVLALFITLSSFNANSASAAGPYNTDVPGCTDSSAYSVTTGQPCNNKTPQFGCKPGDLFSSLTGQSCGGSPNNPPDDSSVSQFNNLFKSSFRIGSRGDDVKALQQFLKDEDYYFGKVDGKYGRITARAVKDFQEDNDIVASGGGGSGGGSGAPLPTQSPVISGVSGPQTLNVNQQGTWTVKASSPYGGNLSYSVIWGDENRLDHASGSNYYNSPQQNATLTHSYSQAGTYTPTFTVTSKNTIQCFTTPCPSNGGSVKTSLSVRVESVVIPTITVLSPNGGESWQVGTTQTIRWTAPSSLSNVTIAFNKLYECKASVGIICPTLYSSRVLEIKNVPNTGLYEWNIPTTFAEVKYTVTIFDPVNLQISDDSNAPFSIVAATIIQPSIINSLPQTAKVLFTSGANTGERRREIYALDIDNGVTTKITSSGKHHIITGIDKSRRYIVSSQTEKDTNKPDGLGDEDKRSLWFIDLETKKETRLTNIENNAEGDSFSPDSEWIVFMMTSSGESQPDIYKIKKDGTELTKLTDTKTVIEGDPEFSHDGKKIVFTSLDSLDANSRNVIKIMDFNGQNIQTIYDGGNGVRVGSFSQGNYDPSFSPDDGWIVFERATAATGGNWGSGIWHIFKVKRDGSGLVDLSEKGGHKDASEYLPSFSPDGKSIIFGSLFFNALKPEQSYNSIFLMDANSGLAKRLTIDPTGVGDMYPVFIPTVVPVIVQPSITILSPNGGEQYPVGSTQTIKWTSNGLLPTDFLYISLYNENSLLTSNPMSLYTTNDGSENWTVPNGLSLTGKYRIEIKKANNSLISDKSDAVFSIVAATTPSITVLSPNGGEEFALGSTAAIRWRMGGNLYPYISVYLQPEGSNTVYSITGSNRTTDSFRLVSSGTNIYGFDWYVGDISGISNIAGRYKILVQNHSGTEGSPDAKDLSDNYFTITAPTPPTGCTSTSGFSSTTGLSCGN